MKQTTSDVFGHVASAIKDMGRLNYQTKDFNDLLGDLTTVMKCSAGLTGSNCPTGQLRTFTYDGLGRLTQANNPESNTFTYSYSANNVSFLALQSRTDPRGSRPTTTTTRRGARPGRFIAMAPMPDSPMMPAGI